MFNCRSESHCPFQCEQCLLRFPTELKIQNHKKNKDKACYRYLCDVLNCEERFLSKKKLKEHRISHEVQDQEVPEGRTEADERLETDTGEMVPMHTVTFEINEEVRFGLENSLTVDLNILNNEVSILDIN